MKYEIGQYLTPKRKFAGSLVARYPGRSPANRMVICFDYQVIKGEIRNCAVSDTEKHVCRATTLECFEEQCDARYAPNNSQME